MTLQPQAISQRLDQLAADADGESVSLNWVLEQLNERAFGLFLLILALPCCIPFLYGLPQVVSLPLMFVAAQILLGRDRPWLPAKLANRTVSSAGLRSLSQRAGPWLRRIEFISKPRLAGLTRAPSDRFVGFALVAFSASILVPLPLTNTVPGFAVVVIAMGLLQRDGLLVLGGLILGTAWIASLIFAGVTVISLIRGWFGI
ncbi:MAG: exopolysaccharide biosynthesis protein [Paracoccaceae bacterium]